MAEQNDLSSELQKVHQDLEEWRAKAVSLEQELMTSRDHVAAATNQAEQTESVLLDAREQLKSLGESRESLTNELSAAQQEIAELQHQLEEKEKQWSEAESSAADENRKLALEAEEKLAAATAEVTSLQQRIAELEASTIGSARTDEQQQERIDNLSSELEQTKNKCLELTDNLRSSEVHCDELSEKMNTLKLSIADSEASHKDVIDALERKVQILTDENSGLREELHSAMLRMTE